MIVMHAGSSHPAAILAILVATYGGIALGRIPGLKLDRTGIALLGAIALMAFGGVTAAQAASQVNWPSVLLLFGFFVISAQLQLSGFFHLVADAIAARVGHPARFLLGLMLVSAGLSSLLNNDVVCAVFTPIVASALIARRLNPVPFLIALAVSSNIGAAATLVGNAQDMMIGSVAHLNFGSYLLWSALPVLFALGSAYAIIWALSRGKFGIHVSLRAAVDAPVPLFDRGHTIKGLSILAVVVVLFFTPIPREITALAAAGIHLASRKYRTRELLGLVNWPILVLFMSLFVVTDAFQEAGYGARAIHALAHAGVDIGNPVTLVLTTAGLSNLINNSAAVMLLLKLVDLSHPVTGYLLALSNSFGGNLIVVGSVANIIVVQEARALGVKISFRDFARLGIPVTLAALAGLLGWAALVPLVSPG